MTLDDKTERRVEAMCLKTTIGMDERILRDAFAKLEKSPAISHKTSRTKFTKRFISIAAIAAVITIIFFVKQARFNTRLAAPKQIYTNLEKTGNFCISNYHAEEDMPFEQVWVLKTSDMKMFKNNENGQTLMTLYDIPKHSKMISLLSADSIQTEKITNEMLDDLGKALVQAFSLKQFSNFKEIPKNASWRPVHDTKITSLLPGSDVFDLLWHKKNSEAKMQYFKLRVFVTENTNILRRTELYIKSEPEGEFELVSFSIVSYPDEEYIKDVIRSNFGPMVSLPSYRPTGTP